MPKTIIVADDDLMTRTVMNRHLTAMGFNVILNESGDQVYKQVQQYQPVACFIDLVMDGKEGIQTITELSSLPNKPAVIAFSSNDVYLDLASELGADAVMTKPVSPDKLKETLLSLGVEVA